MVTVRSIPPGVEVFNTYGATLGNASLLGRYGFILEGSETDTVTFGWPGSSLELDGADMSWKSAYTLILDSTQAREDVAGSSMVYLPESDAETDPALSIDSDGRVSIALLIWAVFESMGERHVAEHVDEVTSVIRCLLRVEALRDMEEQNEDVEMVSDTEELPTPAVSASLLRPTDMGLIMAPRLPKF